MFEAFGVMAPISSADRSRLSISDILRISHLFEVGKLGNGRMQGLGSGPRALDGQIRTWNYSKH